MESEIELNETVHEMHVMATVPEYYQILVDLRCVQSLLQLIGHDNTGQQHIDILSSVFIYEKMSSLGFNYD